MEKLIIFTDGITEVIEDGTYFNNAYGGKKEYYSVNITASGKSIGAQVEEHFAHKKIDFKIKVDGKVTYERKGMNLLMCEQSFEGENILVESIRFRTDVQEEPEATE